MLPPVPSNKPQKVRFSYYVLGKINKAATLNFNFFEHGSDVIEEESPYKPESPSLSFYSKANQGIKPKVDKGLPRLMLHRVVFLWSLNSSAVRQQNARLDQE